MAQIAASHCPSSQIPAVQHPPTRDPIPLHTIGYISADFVDHPTADLALGAILTQAHQPGLKVFCYALTRNDGSPYREQLESDLGANFRFLPTNATDKRWADLIRADGVQVLIHLNGHTDGARLGICARRPAPVQILSLGYPGTSGGPYFDYNVTDATVAEHTVCTEGQIVMPHVYQMNSHKLLYPDIRPSPRSQVGIPANKLVFCNFGRLGRVEPHLLASWARILQKTPNSVLCLLERPSIATRRLSKAFAAAGIKDGRVVFLPSMEPKAAHLARVAAADLYLDTLTYNGHTTVSDALWVRVPVITCAGREWQSRVAASLTTAAGLSPLVVDTLQEYEDRAVQLATDPKEMRRVKHQRNVSVKHGPLFDYEDWSLSFMAGLTEIWESRQTDGVLPRWVCPPSMAHATGPVAAQAGQPETPTQLQAHYQGVGLTESRSDPEPAGTLVPLCGTAAQTPSQGSESGAVSILSSDSETEGDTLADTMPPEQEPLLDKAGMSHSTQAAQQYAAVDNLLPDLEGHTDSKSAPDTMPVDQTVTVLSDSEQRDESEQEPDTAPLEEGGIGVAQHSRSVSEGHSRLALLRQETAQATNDTEILHQPHSTPDCKTTSGSSSVAR